MALDVTSLGSRGNTAVSSTMTVELSRAPNANTLVIVTVAVNDSTGLTEPSGVVGAGMVFSRITSGISFNTIASPAHNLTIWRGMSATPDVSRVTATFQNNNTGCAILVDEVSGVSTSGTSGANAVGQSATSVVDTSATLRVVGPSAVSTANGWYVVQSANSTERPAVGQNFTSIASAGFLTADTHVMSAWTTLSTGTICIFTASGTDQRAGVIVELVLDNPAVGGGTVPSPYYASYYYPRVVAA